MASVKSRHDLNMYQDLYTTYNVTCKSYKWILTFVFEFMIDVTNGVLTFFWFIM